jgi:hypothetical protein
MVNTTALATWKNQDDVDVHCRAAEGVGWNDQIINVNSVGDGSVSAHPEMAPMAEASRWYLAVGSCFFENALEILDTAGEWYNDIHSHTVYYKPHDSVDMAAAEVIAPVVESPLIRVQGTGLKNMVHDIQFYGIRFMHSTWMLPTEKHGWLNIQAGYSTVGPNGEWGTMPLGVHIEKAYNISVERCVIKNMGAAGIGTQYAVHDIKIIGNVVENIAGTGIFVASPVAQYPDGGDITTPADPLQRCVNVLVGNNYVYPTSRMYMACMPIYAGYATSLTIEHNEIPFSYYSGISCGWGWSGARTVAENNVIQFNHIQRVLQVFRDGAGVYTLSAQPGSHIFENYIHNVPQAMFNSAIYTDEGSDGITIEHNVMQNLEPGVNLIGVNTGGNNPWINNESQDQAVIDNAGIVPEYQDIKNMGPAPSRGYLSVRQPPVLRQGTKVSNVFNVFNTRGQKIASISSEASLSPALLRRELHMSAGIYLVAGKNTGSAVKKAYPGYR